MKQIISTIIDKLVESGEEFTYSPTSTGALIEAKTSSFTIYADCRSTEFSVTSATPLTLGDAELCGDYPAPCNCDDPRTHDRN